MGAIANEILASLEEFSASLEAEIRGMSEFEYQWYMISRDYYATQIHHERPEPTELELLAENAPLVFGKGNRDRRIELAKEGLCSFCRPHRGDNRTWHRPKPDRHKNHRRS